MITEVNTIEDLTDVWSIVQEASIECDKTREVLGDGVGATKTFQVLSEIIRRPLGERLMAVEKSKNGEPVSFGVCIIATSLFGIRRPWVLMAYARKGVLRGVKPLLTYCEQWVKKQGFDCLCARRESLHESSHRLFQQWGFVTTAVEYYKKL